MQNLLNIRRELQERYEDRFAYPSSAKGEPFYSKEDAFILQLKEIFEGRMNDPHFDLDTLSRELHLSRSQLGRKVKALTGKSPAIYLRYLRLQKARSLLLNTDLSVKEVAFDTGFSNPAYFSNAYAETFGESPSSTRDAGKMRK